MTVRAVQLTRELTRISALPRRAQDHDVRFANELTALLRRPDGTQALRPIQAFALLEMARAGGLFAPIRVGAGKTLITLLAPIALGSRRPLLLLPAKLVDKTNREIRALSKHWKIPNYIRIVSYEMLGRVQSCHLLSRYQPDLIVADEVHRLRNRKAAVTRRVARYLADKPATKFVGLSGTITKRSIRDYEHLLRWALKAMGTPLPNAWGEVEDWADALDEHSGERIGVGALAVFSDGVPTLPAVREGFRRRLTETTGVVSTIDQRVACSLSIQAELYPQNAAIRDAFERLRGLWELPDGHPLVDGMSVWRHARELALGLYYRWDPRPPDTWLLPRRDWAKACRAILSSSRKLDSELAVIQAIDRGEHAAIRPVLSAWRAVKPTFEPVSVPVWLDEGPARWVVDHAKRAPMILWSEHVAFAKKVATLGNLCYYGRNGTDDFGHPIEEHDPKRGSCIASVASNSEGRNLQAWSRALVTSPVPNGQQWEQLLGRLHRDGQEADEVQFDVMLGCAEHVTSFWRAFTDAHYVQQTTGQEQKLLFADLNVPPEVDDPAPQWRTNAH